MNVCHHGSDISSAIGFAALGELDRLQVLLDRLVEVHAVTFVERVNLAAVRQTDVGVGKDEFTQALHERLLNQSTMQSHMQCPHIVQRVAIYTVAHRKYEVGRRTIHAVTRHDKFPTGAKNVLNGALGSVRLCKRCVRSHLAYSLKSMHVRFCKYQKWYRCALILVWPSIIEQGVIAHVDTGINVARTVKRIKYDAVFAAFGGFDNDRVVHFLY